MVDSFAVALFRMLSVRSKEIFAAVDGCFKFSTAGLQESF